MRWVLYAIVVVSGLIETTAAVSLAIMRWDHPVLKQLLGSMGESLQSSSGQSDLLLYFAALVLLLGVGLHFLALRWLRDEKEEAHHLLNLYGAFTIIGGVLLFLAVGTAGPGWFFLIVDSLRGALLLVFSFAVLMSPQTLRELQLPGTRTSRSSRFRRSSVRVGRGRSRRGGDRSARDRSEEVQRGDRSARDRSEDVQRGDRSARDRSGEVQREGTDRPDRVSGDRTRRAGRGRPSRKRRPQHRPDALIREEHGREGAEAPKPSRRGRHVNAELSVSDRTHALQGRSGEDLEPSRPPAREPGGSRVSSRRQRSRRPAGQDARDTGERQEVRRRPDRRGSRRKPPDSRQLGDSHGDKTPGGARGTRRPDEAGEEHPRSPVPDSSALPWGLVRDIPSETSDVGSGSRAGDDSGPTGGREIRAGRRPRKGRYSTGALFRPRLKRLHRPLGGTVASTRDRSWSGPERVSSAPENKDDELSASTPPEDRNDEPDAGVATENSSADRDRKKQGTDTDRSCEDDE